MAPLDWTVRYFEITDPNGAVTWHRLTGASDETVTCECGLHAPAERVDKVREELPDTRVPTCDAIETEVLA